MKRIQWREFFSADNIHSTTDAPSIVTADFLSAEADGVTMAEWFKRFDFGSQEELRMAIRNLFYHLAGDRFISCKGNQERDIHVAAVYRRSFDVIKSADKVDSKPQVMAASLWGGFFARHNLQERLTAFYAKKPTITHEQATDLLKQVYGFSDADIEKLRFFIEQVKAGDEFPCSLRRMLYIWGARKQTGKTTIARMLTALLNGTKEWRNSAGFESSLAYEMQIRSYAVPRISECSCVMMDECFFVDMGKVYADFKRFLTSRDGRARLPYGQEFQWFGTPNYIATSNEPLQSFIKDWNDRRYLSIELADKPVALPMSKVLGLWHNFILTSTRRKDWTEWSADIADISNIDGEKQVLALEFENDLRHDEVANMLLNLPCNEHSRLANVNRVTLKFFIDYFAVKNADARKRRDEIAAAVTAVFGKPTSYGSASFWLVPDLRVKAMEIKEANVAADNE